MLKELGLGRHGMIGFDLLSQITKLVVDDDRRIVFPELPGVGTLDQASPWCFLIPSVVQRMQRPLRIRLRKRLPKDEYIPIDDLEKEALPGVDGFLGPASVKANRSEFEFGAKVLRWR